MNQTRCGGWRRCAPQIAKTVLAFLPSETWCIIFGIMSWNALAEIQRRKIAERVCGCCLIQQVIERASVVIDVCDVCANICLVARLLLTEPLCPKADATTQLTWRSLVPLLVARFLKAAKTSTMVLTCRETTNHEGFDSLLWIHIGYSNDRPTARRDRKSEPDGRRRYAEQKNREIRTKKWPTDTVSCPSQDIRNDHND